MSKDFAKGNIIEENNNETFIEQFRCHDEEKTVNSSTIKNLLHASLTNEYNFSTAAANGVENNSNSGTMNIDFSKEAAENHAHDHTGSDFNQISDILRVSSKENGDHEINENHDDCGDECMCKIKQALSLIVEEIKKVDEVINVLASKGNCPSTPNSEDKKEFVKSVQKNASVCHVIIEELKKQRAEINDMLKMYEVSTREFAILELTLNRQREKIQRIETDFESLEEMVKNVRIDVNKRHEDFLNELRKRRARIETREEILKTFVDWIASLETKRVEEKRKFDELVEEAILARNKDRKMLTLAVKQLQEVRKIEMLINMQPITTRETKDRHDEMRPNLDQPRFLPSPINGYYQQPYNNINNPTANGNLAQFNLRCEGGADVYGTTRPVCAMEAPSRYEKNNHGLCTKKRRVPIGKRKSLFNNSRRQMRNSRNERSMKW